MGTNFIFILSLAVCRSASVSCLDETLAPVAWWVILKEPGGLAYSYMDGRSESTKMPHINGKTLDTNLNALGGTLQQIIDHRETLGVLQWNDVSQPAAVTVSGRPTHHWTCPS